MLSVSCRELTPPQACCQSPPPGRSGHWIPPPPPPGNGGGAAPLWTPGRVEELLQQAALAPQTSGEVDCPFAFPNQDRAVRAFLASGPGAVAIQRAGLAAARQALAAALAAFRTSEEGYRLRNRFRYVIATV